MNVLMFGWEFPPYSSGGLGTACYGLTRGLSNSNINITFVVPKAPADAKASHVNLIGANNLHFANIKFKKITSTLVPYISSDCYDEQIAKMYMQHKSSRKHADIYGNDLFDEVHRFSEKANAIARSESFDVIHCHDWMTYKAGINAKKAAKKPLIVHVHATEFDRTGGNVNQNVYDIEREGMHAADAVIAVSNFTKNKIVQHYGIDSDKVHVVHNAVDFGNKSFTDCRIDNNTKTVLFLGRITLQKGPDYFLYAARKVLEHEKNVRFVIAGSGDMEPFIINKAAELGIADRVLFTGFLTGDDVDRAYQMADLYVMPSVSEPFGITPLEAMRNDVPVIISKQSGVSEVINHCLKVDFWDINELANKIISVLRYKDLHEALKENGSAEVQKFDWDDSARKCISLYNMVTGGIAYG